jgi:hypothetical protein
MERILVSARTLLAGAAAFSAAIAVPLILDTPWQVGVEAGVDVQVVTVRNDCPRTAWLYFGRHPPLQPQDMFAMGPHMQSVEPVMPGDMLWLLDANAQELDRAVFEAGVETISVLRSCTHLRANVGR